MSDAQQNEFSQWLQSQLKVDNLSLENWQGSDNGYSNETRLFDAHYTQNGVQHSKKMVQRLAPSGAGPTLFKEYDLNRQCQVMDYVGQHSSLPVASIVARDLDAARPYFVMDYIAGEVPGDGHMAEEAYMCKGFLYEGTPAQRETFFTSMISTIADCHKVPVDEDFATSFGRSTAGDTALQKEVNWWVDLYQWGKNYSDVKLAADKYIEWLAVNVPALNDNNILWGDARLADVLVQDYKISAALDWEMATLGPGELDLFYHIGVHEYREKQQGASALAGIPSEAEQIALYEEFTGQKVRHADFFRVFNAVRSLVIQLIFGKMMGAKPEEVEFLEVFINKLNFYTGH